MTKIPTIIKGLIILAIGWCLFWIYVNMAASACVGSPTREDCTGIPPISYPYNYQGVLDPGSFHRWLIISEDHEYYDGGLPYYVIIKNPDPDNPISYALVEVGQDDILRIMGFAYYHETVLLVYGSIRLIDGSVRYVNYPIGPMQKQFIKERLPKAI